MTDAAEREAATRETGDRPPFEGGEGLYLYGITRSSIRADAAAEESREGDAGPVRLVERGDLAAIVRPVALSDFDAERLRQRAEDPTWLAAAVQQHNAVIAAVHARRAVLPARFGSVYASAEDVAAALESSHDRLASQLARLEGCDEWGIHVYADRPSVESRVVAEDPALRAGLADVASASAGKAYFLRRKLLDQVADATEQALVDLAQSAFDRLLRLAVDGEVSPSSRRQTEDAELEILRAAYLVRRAGREAFLAELAAIAEETAELRCEYSGPWPPYSFAAPLEAPPGPVGDEAAVEEATPGDEERR